jgi:hypothetical protein
MIADGNTQAENAKPDPMTHDQPILSMSRLRSALGQDYVYISASDAQRHFDSVSNASSSSLGCFGLIRPSSDMTQLFREGTTAFRFAEYLSHYGTSNVQKVQLQRFPISLQVQGVMSSMPTAPIIMSRML